MSMMFYISRCFHFPVLVITIVVLTFTACRKDPPANDRPIPAFLLYANKAPVANAGPDILIGQASCASLRFTILDGSRSYDPDNNIRTFHWKKIAGPADGSLSNNGNDTAIYVDIRRGLYSFELTVTDSTGLVSKDTMVVDAKGWSQPNYELNFSFSGTYLFEDNYEDCSDYPDCTYYDRFLLNGAGADVQLGGFNLGAFELADTSSASGNHFTGLRLTGIDGNDPYNRFIGGPVTVFFKQVIQNGGGSFSGFYHVNEGSARSCNQAVYDASIPMTITGHIDTSSRQISLRITGATYF